MPPDETDEDRLEKLPEDPGTPFQPAANNPNDLTGDDQTRINGTTGIDPTHPQGDTNTDETAGYHAGTDAAMGVPGEPNAGNAVVGYNPDEDQRRQSDDNGEEKPAA